MILIVLMRQRICEQSIEEKKNNDLSVNIALFFIKRAKTNINFAKMNINFKGA